MWLVIKSLIQFVQELAFNLLYIVKLKQTKNTRKKFKKPTKMEQTAFHIPGAAWIWGSDFAYCYFCLHNI